ncbi:E3 ubiquitin-protein ligase RNF139 [Parasteatoda tepidariorum]|uniref:E3 ubiquitin-protein ligase RNF139 n=1 Tax=Parasteatoda tepidariorum TaxID=114398 RepID=UPI00077FAE8F|nr:E3 ubiquitin-protein ligase RNF139 [Parasteatoda tepidariorum]XP_042898397.1 E3 ubiquitin-protein ligase RNF139 [Parasteatoda tepidariorum]
MDNQNSCFRMANQFLKSLWDILFINISYMFRHAEESYRKNSTMASLINQVLFFMLCDCWFCPEDRLTSLYSLLFYNVLGYLFAYADQLLSLQDYSPVIRVSEHSNIRHLAMTATKVVLDLAKVVTFIITGVFVLLVFGLEQGLEHFNPTWTYVVITLFYYVITEPTCQKKGTSLLTMLQIIYLENLEQLWYPVLIRVFSSFTSLLMIIIAWFCTGGGWVLMFSSGYINVYLCLKDMGDHWNKLLIEKSVLDKYRYATKDELNEKDDVCAVCLLSMKRARVTPCQHMFHGECLRICLKTQTVCPMCKQNL